MNGHLPIAGFWRPHGATRRVLALILHFLGLTALARRPTLKFQLLQQCARIGFTPPSARSSHAASSYRAPLEVSPCPNNFLS